MAHNWNPRCPGLGREFPGIVGSMTFLPETAAPINELVNIRISLAEYPTEPGYELKN